MQVMEKLLQLSHFLKLEHLLKESICSHSESKFFPLRSVPYGMINHFYSIWWPPLNVTIFITHVRSCVMGATPMVGMIFRKVNLINVSGDRNKETDVYQDLLKTREQMNNNGVARTFQQLCTSKGDFSIKQCFSTNTSLFVMGTSL